MATWYGLVDESGDLVSVGTEGMFEGGVMTDPYLGYSVVTFGSNSPDFSVKVWNKVSRALVDRPVPLLISRLDDIEAWLQADPDWILAWNAMNATRKTQIRNGWRRVMARLLGGHQWRGEEESVEI
ncbi:MAG: hypothetical protein H0U59_07210 [Gemmatimonadaceae bacterium]|nr:hypothetical protein [Gemmatimonadaceae bacterium]